MRRVDLGWIGFVGAALLAICQPAWGQSYGIELHNTITPAAGGMGGTSLARPQDPMAAVNGNPATLTQFEGTQFIVGGTWAESTYNLAHTGGFLPGLGPFAAKSEAEGSALGGFALTQDVSALGVPATIGLTLGATAGAGLSFRDVPNTRGTGTTISMLDIGSAVGVDLTERLSAGASLSLGTGGIDPPFVGIGAYAYDYALRGALGLNYRLGSCTDLGFYYQTRQRYNFDDSIQLLLPGGNYGITQDLNLDLPDNFGLGIANRSLMDGRLLLAGDVLFKNWDHAAMFKTLYDNQWVLQLGAQYSVSPRVRLRMGYAYAENPIDPDPGLSAGGITPPGAVNAIQYVQGTLAVVNPHRISAGIGIRDVLPGIDLDLLGGGMFEASEQLGDLTSTSLESYWVGAGITWRFGRGSCRRLPAPDNWCVGP